MALKIAFFIIIALQLYTYTEANKKKLSEDIENAVIIGLLIAISLASFQIFHTIFELKG